MKEEDGKKKLQIRNSTAEFLIFQLQSGELEEEAVCRKFRQTANDGKQYNVKFSYLFIASAWR